MSETILQFGAGNFLRAFVDTFVDEINAAGRDVGKIVVVQSTGDERARLLNERDGAFHVLVRGLEKGEPVDRVQKVSSISRALVAKSDWTAIVEVACSPELQTIISNTTEAGFDLEESDSAWDSTSGAPPASFPAKLLVLLKARFEARQDGLTILPCELIAGNGTLLEGHVLKQAAVWKWTDEVDFAEYLSGHCIWVNTLVDRIVSGKPAAHPLLDEDSLLTVAEPFAFWAIESLPGTEWLKHPSIHHVPDVAPYALRKVRILNGAHSALVAYVKKLDRTDITLVREAIADAEINVWLRGLLFEEIVPTIDEHAPDAEAFAHQTLERFANPYLDHKLSDIALHHETKVGIRLKPTRDEFRVKFGREPQRLNEILE